METFDNSISKMLSNGVEIVFPEDVKTYNPFEKEINLKTNVKQEQIQDLLFSREIGWQDVIYDLINTEQLDPWDINIVILTDKYLQKIELLEEADFFVSSKVLLAAALLLRIKSEILLNKYIKSIDEILFGRKEDKKYIMERITLDEEIPELSPKSPIPRFRRVTLQELMLALDKAIVTENRRIKKVVINNNALRESSISMPKQQYSIKDKIQEIHDRLFAHFDVNKNELSVPFSSFLGMTKEEKIMHFSPLLHLENQQKVWLDQKEHFGEIHIWLKDTYFKNNPDPFADLKALEEEYLKEIEAELKSNPDADVQEDPDEMEKHIKRVARLSRTADTIVEEGL
jgi:segregation and condensation protein A